MKIKQGLLRRAAAAAMTLVILLCLSVASAAQALPSVEKAKVRVGFFEFEGYHELSESGIRSGYGYEFMQKLDRYNNWNLEYLGYNCSWAEAQQELINGEIDILTSARKTADREELFDYSEQPIGYSYTLLTVRLGDSRFVVGDRQSYNGMRVGMLKNNSRNDSFAAFASKNNITYEAVMYESNDEMVADLQTGEKIDAIVTSDLRKISNETVLEEFDSSPFYAIVKKGNTALLEQINRAISILDIRESDWRTELKTKYYTPDAASDIVFSAVEMKYLNLLKENNVVLKIISNPDMAPYSYYENGEIKGIAPRVFAEIALRTGLSYEIIPVQTNADYLQHIKDGTYDVDLTRVFDYSLAEQSSVGITEAYMTTVIATLVKDTNNGTVQTVGLVKDTDTTVPFADKLFGSVAKKEYSSRRECTDAIINGDVDGAYMYSYAAQKLVAEDERNRLSYVLMPDYTVDFTIGVTDRANYALLEIINKGVKSVKLTFVDKVIQDELNAVTKNESFIAWLYDHPATAVGVVGAFVLAIFIVLYSISRIVHSRKFERQAQELDRFRGYVCKSNDMVSEVNLDTMQSIRHYYENGRVVSKKKPYCFANYTNYENKIDDGDFAQLTQTLTKEKMQQAIAKGDESFYFEARVADSDGVKKWFSYNIQVIAQDKQHPNNFIIFKKNIDETKRVEEQQRNALQDALETAQNASMAKGQFLSRMSHEIRTPLNAVIGYMDIAKASSGKPEKVMHCVENSAVAARHLLNILNDVLDISSIESGRMKIAKEEFDLKKQITSVSTIFFNQAKERGIAFEAVLNDLTEEWVVGDSLRLNQILMNLLSNAIKFTPENGKVTLIVSQVRLTDAQVFIKFEVSDTGIGMSEEYQSRLFTPFEQESATTAQKYGGTGLGLSITKNLVSMMNGSIDVKSHLNEGTTFTVSISFERAPSNHAVAASGNYSHVRVLVVDDEKSSCDYIKAMLGRCGVKSNVVTSGGAAVQEIKRCKGTSEEYDLCIMDWSMPDMDGVETTRRIRLECDPSLPIIIATAYDIAEFEDRAHESGVTKVVSKPLFQSTIFDLLVSTYGRYNSVPAKGGEKRVSLKGLRVLLAEDNDMNLEIAEGLLTRADIEVTSVTDGQQAVNAVLSAKPGTYDAVLMDIQMPVLNGYEATRKIRESGAPGTDKLPIIAMTANAFDEDIAEALACGMNEHIAKPIDYNKLFAVLGKILSQREN